MIHIVAHARHAFIFQFLCSQELIDASDVLTHLSTTKFIHAAHKSIKEITVVAYHNHRAIELLHGILQHILRLHVEVVRRLVQNQEIHGFEQKFNHCQTTALTTRQHLHVLVACLTTKHECSKQITNLESYFTLCYPVDSVEHSDITIEQLSLILCKIANLHIVPHFQLTIERDFIHDTLHEGGFSLTVITYECHFFASLDGKVHIAKHLMLAIALANFLANQRIVATAEAWWKFQMQATRIDFIHLN